MFSPITTIRRRRSIPTPNAVPVQRNRTASAAVQNWRSAVNYDPLVQMFQRPQENFHADFDRDENSTPLEILKFFWEEAIVCEICTETNRYADTIKVNNHRALRKWTPLSPDEFWKFMGLSSLMGIVKKSSIRDYWSTDEMIATPFFRKIMTRDR